MESNAYHSEQLDRVLRLFRSKREETKREVIAAFEEFKDTRFARSIKLL